MAQKWANNAFSTLGGAIDNLDTSITISPNTGDRFPAVSGDDFFNVTLQNAGGDVEIVKVISRAIGSDQMNIVRGQEATVPQSWAIGDIVELRPTAASFENLSDDIDDVATDVESLQTTVSELDTTVSELDTTVSELDFNADAIGFDDDAVSFEASNVQVAIEKASEAENTSYDSTTSGYVATNVQEAVDETIDRLRNETYAVKQDVQSVATSSNANRVFFEVTNWSPALSITIPSDRSDSEIEITAIIAFEAIHTTENECGVEFALTESTEEGGESTITAIARANYEYELTGASNGNNILKGTATLRARLSPGDGTHTYKIFARNRRAFGTQTVNIQGSTTEQNSTVVIREIV